MVSIIKNVISRQFSVQIILCFALSLSACSKIGFMKLESTQGAEVQTQLRKTLASQLIVTQLMISGPDAAPRNVCQQFTATSAAKNGLASGVASDLQFSVSSSLNGDFYSDPKCSSQQTSFVIRTGFSSQNFYFKPTAEGTLSIIASTGFFPNPANVPSTYVAKTVAQNTAPIANNATFTTLENVPVTGTLTGSDLNGDTLTYSVTNPASKGTVTLNPNGTFTYTPNLYFSGTDTFTFTTFDGALLSTSALTVPPTPPATVKVNVTFVNQPPVAQSQTLSLLESGQTITALPITLTATDVDSAQSALTYRIISPPSHGMLAGTVPNVTYTPSAQFFGTDSFTFQVNDGQLDSLLVGVVSLTIDQAPVASAQAVVVDEHGAPSTGKSITLVATDPEGLSLSYAISAQPTHGNLSGAAPNVIYTPSDGYFGGDSFMFTASDKKSTSLAAKITLTVHQAPTASSQTVLVNENGAPSVSKAVTLFAMDPANLNLTYSVGQPSHGQISGIAPNLSYTPTDNYFGSDSFSFKVNDGNLDSNTAVVSITVRQAPTASSQNMTVYENGSPSTGKPITLVAADPANLNLTYSVGNPSHGRLTGSAPNLTYTPTANYVGSDAFSFSVFDGQLSSNTATVSITVHQTPVASAQSLTLVYNVPSNIQLFSTNLENDSLAYTVSSPKNGTLSGTAPNLTYLPNTNYTGNDSFTFQVTDTKLNINSNTATVLINVVQPVPNVTLNSLCLGGSGAQFILHGNISATVPGVSSIDSSLLVYNVVTAPAHGTAALLSGSSQASGKTIASGGTFTQQDVDQNKLTYTTDGTGNVDTLIFTAEYNGDAANISASQTLTIKPSGVSCP